MFYTTSCYDLLVTIKYNFYLIAGRTDRIPGLKNDSTLLSKQIELLENEKSALLKQREALSKDISETFEAPSIKQNVKELLNQIQVEKYKHSKLKTGN